MVVILTLYGKSETIKKECFSVFENRDFLYLLDDNHDVLETFNRDEIYHCTIRNLYVNEAL